MASAPPPNKIQVKLLRGPLDVPIIQTLYQIYSLFHKLLLKFPKSQRYILGAAIQSRALELLELIISAACVNQPAAKIEYLQAASAKLDLLRLLIRLAKDCKCLSNQDYLDLESKLHKAGRMLGGWLKSVK